MSAGYSEQQYWLNKFFDSLPKVEGSWWSEKLNGRGNQERLDLNHQICRDVVAESRLAIRRFRERKILEGGGNGK